MIREEYEQNLSKYSEGRQIYQISKEIKVGIPRWRLHLFEKDAAPVGDKELLCIERPTEEECMKVAIKWLKERIE